MEADPAAYAAVCARAAQPWHRYAVAIEVGNEVNLSPPVSAYVPAAQDTYRAIKRVAPRLPVLAGALARRW